MADPVELSCADSADLNDSGAIELTDAILVFQYLFRDGLQPAEPFEECGVDPTANDELGCTAATCP